jgi:hypothetical protein
MIRYETAVVVDLSRPCRPLFGVCCGHVGGGTEIVARSPCGESAAVIAREFRAGRLPLKREAVKP